MLGLVFDVCKTSFFFLFFQAHLNKQHIGTGLGQTNGYSSSDTPGASCNQGSVVFERKEVGRHFE